MPTKISDLPPVGVLGWTIGVVSPVAFGTSWFYLHKDALGGYHQIWPVNLFAATGLICALSFGYLLTRWMANLFRF